MKTPIVPTELEHLVTPEVLEVHERWQDVKVSDVAEMVDSSLRTVDLGNRRARVGVFGDNQEGPTLVLGLPHQQALKPAMGIRAALLQEVAVPNGQVIVLPNNDRISEHYAFTTSERIRLSRGDSRPHAELQARILERMGVGTVALTGYSLGGFTTLGIAEVVPNFDITHINADDAPSKKDRDAKTLKSDFMKSGGFGDQLKAIEDANIPALSDIYRPRRLAVDYGRYAVAMLNPDNKALYYAMAGGLDDKVAAALQNYPDAKIKLGHVEGSMLFDSTSITHADGERVRIQQYTGSGTHRHTTGDNPIAHALMAVDGIGRL